MPLLVFASASARTLAVAVDAVISPLKSVMPAASLDALAEGFAPAGTVKALAVTDEALTTEPSAG